MSATIPDILLKEISEHVGNAELETITAVDEASRGQLKVELVEGSLFEWLKSRNFDIEGYLKPMLIVCNTVKDACTLFTEINKRCHGELRVELLHSRLTTKTRSKRESVIEQVQRNLVLIATQVIEAGLDYDFKTLLTEVAPIDALIQRLGRCARKSDGQAFVFLNDESAKAVYPKSIVDATNQLLSQSNIKQTLELSVKQVTPSLNAINQVYTEAAINELKSEVKRDILEVRGYTDAFLRKYIHIARRFYEDITAKLIRLGLELPCIYLSQEELRSLKQNGTASQLSLEEKSFSVSIKSREELFKLRIPSLEHEENGKRVYYVLRVIESRDGNLHLKIESHENLSEVLKGRPMNFYVVVNPQFYHFLERLENGKIVRYEMGVRELYGS